MSWYKTGSVTATSGSKIITGAGTQFTNPLNSVSAGRMLLLPGSGTVQIYEIESVQSDTQLTLVSAFTGTAGSGKSYAIPTSPTVSIEQFAHEFASTLAYYQQQLQGWQSILTGTGNITLTTPDGQSVTVRSQQEWDAALNGKLTGDAQTSSTDAALNRILKLSASGEGAFGLGGNAIAIPAGSTIPTYFNNLPTGFYRAGSNIAGTFSPICDYSWIRHDANNGVLIAVGIGAIGAMAFRLLSAGGWSGWRTVWHDGNITLAGMYADRGSLGTTDLDTLFGSDYRGNWYQSVTATATSARNYPILSAGSLEIQYTGANVVGTVQRYTTHASNRIFIRYKLDSTGAWSAWAEIWTTANLVKQTSTIDATAGAVMINGAWGWGAPAPDTAAFNVATTSELVQLLRGSPPGAYRNKLSEQAWWPGLLTRTGDTFMYIRAGHVANSGAATSGVKILTGSNSTSGEYNLWTDKNLANPMTTDTPQLITGQKTFKGERSLQLVAGVPNGPLYIPLYDADGTTRKGWIGRGSTNNTIQLNNDATGSSVQLMNTGDIRITPTAGEVFHGNQRFLVQGRNAVADSSGFWKTASPVINIYADGSFTTTDEAAGVNVERLSEGVYKITGCQGMHPDAAWNGIDGGVSNPKCRNGLELTWNDFSVESDGSVVVRTYHRPHPEAISFARNEIEGYGNGDPIDVPADLFIQVRVNMPERAEPKPSVMSSNVYCNTIAPA
ncbi:pyocin knob domain-containing protein [Pectobacterium odoriferum]|uniref:pyocin knob domain-containing protein n=1 Tax=Pectobacterium odoriferum TaxID=78398 RepID=UPI001CF40E3B|nr:pyocin knob domain-containing protein [Pectobacterium odoriferum]MCA6962407.1 pyocin knob domain-containing protein [Pectobacterium odoriferum]